MTLRTNGKNRKIFKVLFLLVFCFSFVSSVTIETGTILNSSSSNSSINFISSFNITNLSINSNYIYLYNVNFVNSTGFYNCSTINHSSSNSMLSSGDFNCSLNSSFEVTSGNDETTTSSGMSRSDILLDKVTLVRMGVKYFFNFENQSHYLKLTGINRDSEEANLDIYSEKQSISLGKNETKFLDLDLDGILDFKISCINLSEHFFLVDILLEELVEGEIKLNESEKDFDLDEKGEEEVVKENYMLNYFLIFIILLIFVFLFVLFKKRKKRKKLFGY